MPLIINFNKSIPLLLLLRNISRWHQTITIYLKKLGLSYKFFALLPDSCCLFNNYMARACQLVLHPDMGPWACLSGFSKARGKIYLPLTMRFFFCINNQVQGETPILFLKETVWIADSLIFITVPGGSRYWKPKEKLVSRSSVIAAFSLLTLYEELSNSVICPPFTLAGSEQ